MAEKKMGRPAVDTSPVMVRMPQEMIDALDAYRRTLDDLPTRPELIRRLVEEGLKRGEG